MARFRVVCADYRSPWFSSRAVAERVLAGIVKTRHCTLEHRIESDEPEEEPMNRP